MTTERVYTSITMSYEQVREKYPLASAKEAEFVVGYLISKFGKYGAEYYEYQVKKFFNTYIPLSEDYVRNILNTIFGEEIVRLRIKDNVIPDLLFILKHPYRYYVVKETFDCSNSIISQKNICLSSSRTMCKCMYKHASIYDYIHNNECILSTSRKCTENTHICSKYEYPPKCDYINRYIPTYVQIVKKYAVTYSIPQEQLSKRIIEYVLTLSPDIDPVPEIDSWIISQKCRYCKKLFHNLDECRYLALAICRNCGENGHTKKYCTKTDH